MEVDFLDFYIFLTHPRQGAWQLTPPQGGEATFWSCQKKSCCLLISRNGELSGKAVDIELDCNVSWVPDFVPDYIGVRHLFNKGFKRERRKLTCVFCASMLFITQNSEFSNSKLLAWLGMSFFPSCPSVLFWVSLVIVKPLMPNLQLLNAEVRK